jgi:putative iron-dependent peroxidase
MPDDVVDFTGIGAGNAAGAPVTQSDIWFWCHGNSFEAVWHTAAAVRDALAPIAALQRHQRAYKGGDSRDPTGFIDGTENPLIDEAHEVALVPDGAPGAGGSAVFVQRWVHNLAAFQALPLAAQERVFGRTKADSTQLPPESMPPTSHVSRNTVTDATGDELHIYRRNTPFADIDIAGTMFVGATRDPDRLNEMLRRMFNQAGDGLHDALTGFSTPTSGSWYFVPALSGLTTVLGALAADDDEDDDAGSDGTQSPRRTLGIGSLR